MNCISGSCNISLSSNIRICFSLPTERFKTLNISIIAHSSSWHLQPERHWPRFSVSFIVGSVLAGLCGTVWTYICGFSIMLDNFNHSRCAAIFILSISERNIFSSVDCISYWELSPFVLLFTNQFNFSRVYLFTSSYYKLLWMSCHCVAHVLFKTKLQLTLFTATWMKVKVTESIDSIFLSNFTQFQIPIKSNQILFV